ncbi:MAG: glycosyltransferase [gamma proteobacterium symbiont of Bathyaustriella thionipta]|nr:glycosyltransferase [gamma proteobacterium symbiont of Bathyaustriella thionipta]
MIDIVIPAFNPGSDLVSLVSALYEQKMPDGWNSQVILVDDGSTNKLNIEQVKKNYPLINLVTLKQNSGRACARNAGFNAGSGELVVFIDCDCIPKNKFLIEKHQFKISCKQNDVNFGRVDEDTAGFWGEYFSDLTKSRSKAIAANNFLAMTSQNFSIKREVFKSVGGFDELYKAYGFEDRDLIAILLQKKFRLSYDDEAVVIHNMHTSLSEICRKMQQAGQYTSGLLSKNHPQVYANMPYRFFDASMHPAIKFPAYLFSLAQPYSVKLADWMLTSSLIPFALKKFMVKIFSALAFARGTMLRNNKFE